MKRVFLIPLIAILMSMVAGKTMAEDEYAEVDGIYYCFSSVFNTASVTRFPGSNSPYYVGDVVIPDTVAYKEKTYSVTRIDGEAFYKSINLTSVNIPNSVTEISSSAFKYCSNLTSVNIPNSVTEIGSSAFYGCRNLTSINIPNSVKVLGGDLFYECSSLTTVNIPDSVVFIWANTFYNCSSLTSVTIPNSVIEISTGAFSGCSSLTSITFPNGLNYIARECFNGCSSLTFFTIPTNVRTIYDNAFKNCISLTSVTIPGSVTNIKNGAFSGCNKLTTISGCEGVESIESNAFTGTPWLAQQEETGGLLYIGHVAYKYYGGGKQAPTEIILKEGTKLIYPNAFSGCSALNSVIIPNSVKTIGSEAFSDCSALTSVIIPNSVKTIESNAFGGCKLRNVAVRSKTPPNGAAPFSAQTFNHAVLYVPMGAWEAYSYNDVWYQFKNIRETVTEQQDIRDDVAYTLMDAKTFNYAIYDPVNDCIATVTSVDALNESDPNHCWQTLEISGRRYLYNIGAKKFAVPSTDANCFTLSEEVGSITMFNGEDGLVINGHTETQWVLVADESMTADMNLDGAVTSVNQLREENDTKNNIYDLSGRRLNTNPEHGLFIQNGKVIFR